MIVQMSLRHIQGSDAYRECREPLEVLVRPVQQTIEDMNALVEYQLKRSEDLNKHGLPKVSKTEWLKGSSRIEKLKQNIRDARNNLQAAMIALDLHHR